MRRQGSARPATRKSARTSSRPRTRPPSPSYHLLQRRAGRPVRVGLIGAGKFGSMFLNQIPTMPNVEIAVIADLDPERAREACRNVGWDAARIARTRFVATGIETCADPEIEVVVWVLLPSPCK